jgi:hypothetical protein
MIPPFPVRGSFFEFSMYRCFQLELDNFPNSNRTTSAGHEAIANQMMGKILKIITDKAIKGDVIDATSLQNNWFPEVNVDIFISHSHSDVELARSLSTWLYETFGIISFVDSYVWGYADDLLKKIDDWYCFDKSRNVYYYKQRNRSTAHVHAMLSNALIQMVDQTECLFFLNTPNSIPIKDTVQDKTESPWLYLELMMSQVIPLPDRNSTYCAL